MTMNEIEVLLARLRRSSIEVFVGGPADENAISRLEDAFGRLMPPSYRAFLARYGGLNIADTTYSGIIDGAIDDGRGTAWADTKVAREQCQIPAHYLVVQSDDDGFKCLDFAQTGLDGEHPVIYHMPYWSTPFHELSPSFGAWINMALRATTDAELRADTG